MAKLTLDLNRFKASGIYTVEFDATDSVTISTQTIRLVVGFSRKGPFNAPVFLRDVKSARKIRDCTLLLELAPNLEGGRIARL